MASAVEFSVTMSVCSLYVTNFLILLQHNIWLPSRDFNECTIKFAAGVNLKTHYQTNCNECATAFAACVNLKRHDTLRETVRPYDVLAHSIQQSTGLEWPL